MKFKKILTAGLLILSSTTFSQTISIGPKVGATLTNFGGVKNTSYKPGITAGAFLIYSRHEHTGFGLELLYSGEGSNHENTTINGSTSDKYEYNTRLHYLRIPMNANYFFRTAEDKMRPKISFGPNIGYLIATKQNLTLTNTNAGNTIVTKTENKSLTNYNRLDLGLSLGAGFNYKIKSSLWLNVDLRYNYGLLNILKNSAYGSNRANNQGASISIGIAKGLLSSKN
jgi:hypothetical protein